MSSKSLPCKQIWRFFPKNAWQAIMHGEAAGHLHTSSCISVPCAFQGRSRRYRTITGLAGLSRTGRWQQSCMLRGCTRPGPAHPLAKGPAQTPSMTHRTPHSLRAILLPRQWEGRVSSPRGESSRRHERRHIAHANNCSTLAV
jgi:hypothetical protein